LTPGFIVVAGLDPAIVTNTAAAMSKARDTIRHDRRVKPGDDG
jgi:hypothetical protein